ncbi:MAG: CoA transferase, partial [Castellaniella sp.]|uniref:CoA transferase n=1 Tax=Castellaniella sp. TaxID=1955812 RepID=UPI002A36C2DA
RAVPCGPINAIEQVFDDAQVRARGLRIDMPHPETGTVPLVASPIRLSDTPVDYRLPPPPLGAHTAAVLAEILELAPAEIEALRARGVI